MFWDLVNTHCYPSFSTSRGLVFYCNVLGGPRVGLWARGRRARSQTMFKRGGWRSVQGFPLITYQCRTLTPRNSRNEEPAAVGLDSCPGRSCGVTSVIYTNVTVDVGVRLAMGTSSCPPAWPRLSAICADLMGSFVRIYVATPCLIGVRYYRSSFMCS